MSPADNAPPSRGFPPVESPGARVLILGSLPGQASIDAQQYYAHPRNAFWPIMRELAGASGSYESRCASLMDSGIALWDVLQSSVRPGSLDASIRPGTAVANDFDVFFERQGAIRLVAFNGRKAEELFRRFVQPVGSDEYRFASLPSTSPAHAAMSLEHKLAAWRGILAPFLSRG